MRVVRLSDNRAVALELRAAAVRAQGRLEIRVAGSVRGSRLCFSRCGAGVAGIDRMRKARVVNWLMWPFLCNSLAS
jgi:hypothetical protein